MCAIVYRAEITDVARVQFHILRWLNIRQRRRFLFEEEYRSGTCRAGWIAVGNWNFPFERLRPFLMHRETFLARRDAGLRGLHRNERQTGLLRPAGGDRRNRFPR